jgi:hypothetical protein
MAEYCVSNCCGVEIYSRLFNPHHILSCDRLHMITCDVIYIGANILWKTLNKLDPGSVRRWYLPISL